MLAMYVVDLLLLRVFAPVCERQIQRRCDCLRVLLSFDDLHLLWTLLLMLVGHVHDFVISSCFKDMVSNAGQRMLPFLVFNLLSR